MHIASTFRIISIRFVRRCMCVCHCLSLTGNDNECMHAFDVIKSSSCHMENSVHSKLNFILYSFVVLCLICSHLLLHGNALRLWMGVYYTRFGAVDNFGNMIWIDTNANELHATLFLVFFVDVCSIYLHVSFDYVHFGHHMERTLLPLMHLVFRSRVREWMCDNMQ